MLSRLRPSLRTVRDFPGIAITTSWDRKAFWDTPSSLYYWRMSRPSRRGFQQRRGRPVCQKGYALNDRVGVPLYREGIYEEVLQRETQ